MTDLMARGRAVRQDGLGSHPPGSGRGTSNVAAPDRLWMDAAADTMIRTEDPPPTASSMRPLQAAKSAAESLHPYLTGLVQRLFTVPSGRNRVIRSVVFASVDEVREPGLVSAAVAEILAANVSGAIALVDANFQAPSLHRYYGASNGVGLADALSTTEPIGLYAQQVASGYRGSLWLLPPGTPSGDGEPLLMTEPSQDRMRGLLGAFDYVVIEAPAVTRHRAAALLAAHVDGVVLIAEANVTRRHAVCAAADTLRAAGGRVLGTVLNNRTFPIPKAVYEQL